MSWVLDVSRCLGLVDISSRDIHQPRGPPHAAATAAPASPSPSGASATPSTSAPAKRTVGLRGHNASSPLRRQTKSSTWLLGSPFSRAGHYGPPGGGGGKKMRPIHRSGSRSTPCLMDGEGDDEEAKEEGEEEEEKKKKKQGAVPPPLILKQSVPDLLGCKRGSLVSTPATSSLDSLEVIADSPRCLSDRARDSPRYDSDELGEDSALCPKDSPSPKVTVYSRTSAFRRLTPPSACLMLKDVRSFSCNPGSFLTKSCEVLSPTEAEDSSSTIVTSSSSSNHGGVLVVTDSPARSSSVSHLDCSVSYGTNGTGATPLLVGSGRPAWSEEPSHRNSPRGVFNEARDTLVNRICGAAPPFPSTEHPQRVVRSPRHRFSRSEHTLHRANALLLQQTSSISAGFPERVDSRSSRSGYQKSVSVSALHRPESQRRHSWRRSSSEWSLWAQEVLNSLHDLQERRRARSSTSLPTSASGAGRPLSECSGASSSTFYSHRASLADEGGPGHGIHHQHHAFSHQGVRRTHSDVGGAARLQEALRHYQRQYSTPQPIKLRPAHRLPQHTGSLHRSKSSMKRSKGSSHLRRSISQPLDLDKAIDLSSSLRKIQTSPSHTPPKRQRRPSAGNILNEDNTTSEDEICMSDSEDFRTDLKRSLDEEDMVVYAEALWDHVTLDVEELVFKAGDLITVVDSSDKDWWWGKIHHRTGWFPAAFVRLLVNQEDHQEPQDYQHKGPERKLSISALSQEQVRANVINEIICTERDFVKHLRDVVEGYLKQVRKRPDMFTEETISTIFGNMEALYRFQSTFLRDLEDCIDWEHPHKSCIGAVFTKNRAKFEIYSEYCNNHPSALSELQELYQDQKIVHFFEACRLLQEMIDISLDGFLLTPVQKICKYPLQLQELLKYTKSDHPDYQSVQGALEAMRDVALLVNERKRRMECLEKIASWQITVEGWEGPELLEDSSQLIYQGEVTKGHGGSWPKEVTLFLFDRQLVYCKRDLLKRNTYVYRGRLNLNTCEVVDLMDGKDTRLNATFHNAWKVHSHEKNKWYIFSCKSAVEKRKWMEAFRKERELVAADLNAKFIVSDKAKQHAKIAARNQKNRPKRPRTTKCHKRAQAMTYAQAELLVNVDPEIRSNSLPSGVQPLEGKKKGLWFSFGGNKKGRGSGRGLACPVQHHPV